VRPHAILRGVTEPIQNRTETPEFRLRLERLRSALLSLHKTLVDSERVEYESTMGKIQNANHFLQLLITDPWFAWLSPLSQLLVSIDEALDAKEPLTLEMAETFFKQSVQLLVASETGPEFSKHYYVALQRDPDVVMAHAEVARLHRKRKASPGS
jgi:hypothetical protein